MSYRRSTQSQFFNFLHCAMKYFSVCDNFLLDGIGGTKIKVSQLGSSLSKNSSLFVFLVFTTFHAVTTVYILATVTTAISVTNVTTVITLITLTNITIVNTVTTFTILTSVNSVTTGTTDSSQPSI